MAVTVGQLVAAPELGLTGLVDGDDTELTWAHSSDLLDPTPFLAAGNVLLTTGAQLVTHPDETLDAYVDRLAVRGLAGLGLGTGLALDAAPVRLVDACRERRLTLFEVPYRVPFLAIARWVADAITAEAVARDAWSVTAQRAIALAALSPRRLDGVLDELARQLPGRVLLFDGHGTVVARHGHGPVAAAPDEAEIRADARRLLARNTRAGGARTGPGGTVALQTLGRRDHLRGVLATITAGPSDPAATAVVTGAVALAELSLEDRVRAEAQQSAIDAQLFRLLLAGEVDAVRDVATSAGRRLPEPPVRVLACRPAPGDRGDLVAAVLARAGERSAVVSAPYEDLLVLVVVDTAWRAVAEVFRGLQVGVGVSGATDWNGLGAALASARAAWTRTGDEGDVVAADAESLFGLLPRGAVTDLARRRLDAVLLADDGADLLHAAETWLRNDARYDRAARELDLHRHSVKAKVRRVGSLLGLDLATFDGKAELWALLRAR